MSNTIALVALICSLALASCQAAEDLVIADFEDSTYGSWQVTGEAFGSKPASGTLPGQMHVDGYQGRGLVNSFNGGDGAVGTLTSPAFTIQRKYISFLIGGGSDREKLAVQLLIDGQSVRVASGNNDRPGGSETLSPGSWDVNQFMGKQAVIRIIDDARGGWGHINVDHLLQSDQKPIGLMIKAQQQLIASKRYLHFPIDNGGQLRKVSLLVDGKVVVRNDIALADQTGAQNKTDTGVDWWAPMDVSLWSGKQLTIQVDQLPENSKALDTVELADTIKQAERLYDEPLRAQFHFSPRRGWNNDPNGLVFFNGEYHMFFQHNPYGWGWGNMHWGHAVSRDLIHWQELGDALLPDELGPMFSGSAVVDWKNTSGFGKEGQPPLVLIYTAAGNPTVQAIAYSLDGRSFTKFQGNPVLPQITSGNRDPKVIWHQPTSKWIMALYVEKPAKLHTVHLFSSSDLRQWKLESIIPGDPDGQRYLFECPDMFELAIDGRANDSRWVLLGADSQYALGKFDGHQFSAEAERLVGQRGRGFYAPQTFSDIPQADGRRIQIGWFQTETKGMPFNQSMTVPLELKLKTTATGPRLTFQPVVELQKLRGKSHAFSQLSLDPATANPFQNIAAELIEFRAAIEPQSDSVIELSVRGVTLKYHAKQQEIEVDGKRVPAPMVNQTQNLIVLCDRVGVEIFASDGLVYIPLPITPDAQNHYLEMKCLEGKSKLKSAEVHELLPSW